MNNLLGKIREKGITGIVLALYYRRFLPIYFLTGFFLITLFLLLRPFIQIKIGRLFEQRIGHLAIEPEIFLRQLKLGSISNKPFYMFLCDPKKVANRQIYRMLKGKLRIIESQFLLSVYQTVLPILKTIPLFQPLSHSIENCLEFAKASPVLKFNKLEELQGDEMLSRLGFVKGEDWFVCIFARDSAYLNKTIPNGDWRYHNIRNIDIDKFNEATQFLLDQGAWVFRIGSVVEKPMKISHPRLIDYPYSDICCDFMDVYLVAKAKFILGTSSGITNTAWVFNVPTMMIGTVHFLDIPLGKNSFFIPKKIKDLLSDSYLSFFVALR
ncbi:MAG: TIGR04372 family glycosyltransferase [Magnetococcales bacterium]|nr:TIGR04372 family glycosyltransferase [Magnetococcales bacterium]